MALPTKKADRKKGTKKLIKMIRQFILMGVIFPGGGRAFFNVSMFSDKSSYYDNPVRATIGGSIISLLAFIILLLIGVGLSRKLISDDKQIF